MVRDLSVTDAGAVSFTFLLAPEDPATLVRQARAAVQAVEGVRRDEIKITVTNPAGPARATHRPAGRTTPCRPRPPAPVARGAAEPGPDHRDLLGQGRGREVHRRRQSGGRAGAGRRPGRA